MLITELPEVTTYDDSCYMPIDVDGATYKTQVNNITPNIANNFSTYDAGYVLDASKGKALNDAITANSTGISNSNNTLTNGIVVGVGNWILHESRNANGTQLHYPRNAKEVLISISYDDGINGNFVYNAIFLPGTIQGNILLQMGGYAEHVNPANPLVHGYFEVPVYYDTRIIDNVNGEHDGNNFGSNSSIITKVYYR